jgi:hypothetical protein
MNGHGIIEYPYEKIMKFKPYLALKGKFNSQ